MKNEFGYTRIGCVSPELRLGDVRGNTNIIIREAFTAYNEGCDIIIFPEMSFTGYTCGDLFQQSSLYRTALDQLARCAGETSGLPAIITVGLPVFLDGRMYNVAAVLYKGSILGLVPKTYIPNHNEFYEARWFTSGIDTLSDSISISGIEIPFGTDLLFQSGNGIGTIGIELCEDMWAPIPPSARMALAGADIILNLSASNELAGKAEYRRSLIAKLSGQQLCAYAYCSAGAFESTTDTVYGGHQIIAENGHILAEGERFSRKLTMTIADVDSDFLGHERINNRTFSECSSIELARVPSGRIYRLVELEADASAASSAKKVFKPEELCRTVDPRPFVPAADLGREARCSEIFKIQSAALASRISHIGCSNVILGLSGGLDSTLALLVALEAFKSLGLPTSGINCITMPGFGTTKRTKGNAKKLCEALGLEIKSIDIKKACRQHFADIDHDGVTTDITYENTQARERTQILMDIANKLGGIVIGTGDLSEQAMGWSTYNGDHMSNYGVNTGVPKTLVRFLVEYYITHIADRKTSAVLADINATPISPELLPPDADGNIAQKTEDKIGPYELHDFFLYQIVRCGFAPRKVIFLAQAAFTKDGQAKYSREEIKKWLALFYRRFFSQQFKRSCVPDGPKVGTIALSPRADWRMPSDASVQLWLEELED
ncbi:MAG: NAD(+) synthase [Spirochaetales bacterium]|nr:NAD(+) synthase [Spirochaetales bacterium]